jgi:hypothetical protein
LIGSQLRAFAHAWSLTEETDKPPAWADKIVARVSAMSAQATLRGE